MIERVCQVCTKTYLVYPCRAESKYCSKGCYTPTGRKGEDMRGENNPKWRGGITGDGLGRVLVYAPDHPNAVGCYVYRYRIVAAKMLGRPLEDDEIVHHIDGDVSNDAPENLRVMTQAEHASLHSLAWHEADRLRITHCKNGHLFDDQNTILREDGVSRRCRTCKTEYNRSYYLRQKGTGDVQQTS